MYKRKTFKVSSLLLVVCMLVQLIGVQVSAATQEKVYDSLDMKITFKLVSSWEGGYNAEISINNPTDVSYEDWALEMVTGDKIANMWNAGLTEKEAGKYQVTNLGYNQDVKAGKTVTFGYTAASTFTEYPEIKALKKQYVKVDASKYSVDYKVNSDWGSGANAEIAISNKSDEKISEWKLTFDFGAEIANIWGANVISHEGTQYIITGEDYNQNLDAGATVKAGFTLATGNNGLSVQNATLEKLDYVAEEETVDGNQVVNEILDSIEIGYQGTDSAICVTQNVILPTDASQYVTGTNATITWASSDTELIQTDGTVERPYDESELVTLTATVTLGDVVESKDFELKVVKSIYDDYTTDYIEDYDSYEYLFEFNDWSDEENFQIYENDEGYMDYLVGSYTDAKIESPAEVILSLYHLRTLLGLSDPESELSWIQTTADSRMVSYRFRQMYNGVPVEGGSIIVATDRDGVVKAVNNNLVYNIDLDVNPALAESNVISSLSSEYSNISSQGLCIYTNDNGSALAWKINATDATGSYLIYVNAATGAVIDKTSIIFADNDPNRVEGTESLKGYYVEKGTESNVGEVYYLWDTKRKIQIYEWNRNSQDGYNDYSLPYYNKDNFDWDVGDRACYTELYRHVIDVYDYFLNKFDRKGMYGDGRKLNVFYDINSWHNAFSDPTSKNLLFYADYYNAADVVAHEFTHGIVHSLTDLRGADASVSAAINEAYADIFGELFEGNSSDWIHGNGHDGERDMSKNPYKSNKKLAEQLADHPDEHDNCKYIDYVCYYMHDHGMTVLDLENIWYDSLSLGYKSDATFYDVRKNVLAAASISDVSKNEYKMIQDAFKAIGLEDGSVAGSENIVNKTVGTNTLFGTVVEADTDGLMNNNDRLQGVEVKLYKGSTLISTQVTNENGEYTFFELKPGDYTLTFTMNNYLTATMYYHISGTMNACYAPIVEMISENYEGYGIASGVITDAVTGLTVSGLDLKIRKGINNTQNGSIEYNYMTDNLGAYKLENFPAGNYCIRMVDNRTGIKRSEKYVESCFNIIVLGGETIGNQNGVVSKKVNVGQMRIVLEWGATPYDLDSHLVGYNVIVGYQDPRERYHIYFSNKTYSGSSGGKNVFLDLDDTDGYGPETTTIYAADVDYVVFYVYNWSGTPEITSSGATVSVYRGDATNGPAVFNIPQSGEGLYWTVFKYNITTDILERINVVSDSPIL